MKKFFSWTLALGLLTTAALPGAAQTVLVGTGTPNASAALDVQSTNQGMLVPRLTVSQRTAISNAATGLLVYQTDGTAGFYYYDGSVWSQLGGSSGGTTLPSQVGNAGKVLTTDGSNLSFTSGYTRETVTALPSTPGAGANTSATYTLPAFANGVNTQTIVVTGANGYGGSFTFTQYVLLPDPATVPDGSRVILKAYSTIEPTKLRIGFSFGNYPSTSYYNGQVMSASTPVVLNGSSGLRTCVTLMKISHAQLAVTPTGQTYSSWIFMDGYKEE